MIELYSYSKYKGYSLFVEVHDDGLYEGVAMRDHMVVFNSSSTLSGDHAEAELEKQVDDNESV